MRLQIAHFILLIVPLLGSIPSSPQPTSTFVTALWDIGRNQLSSSFARGFDFYLHYFGNLLETESNLIIFGDSKMKQFVEKKRKRNNTVFIVKELNEVEQQWFVRYVQEIREQVKKGPQDKWRAFSNYPQYGLKMYNPVVMSKPMLLEEALQHDIFNSQYLLWIDAGITHTAPPQSVKPSDNLFQRIPHFFPFDAVCLQTSATNQLLYGFVQQGKNYVKAPVTRFVLAGFIGVRKEAVSTFSWVYQNFLRLTLQNGEMWTEESVLSLMLPRYAYFMDSLYNFNVIGLEMIGLPARRYIKNTEMRIYHAQNNMEKQEIRKEFSNSTHLQAREIIFLQTQLEMQNWQLIKSVLTLVFFAGVYFFIRRQFQLFSKRYQIKQKSTQYISQRERAQKY